MSQPLARFSQKNLVPEALTRRVALRSVQDMTNHSNCSHPATKSERAKCRRARQSVADVKTSHALMASAQKRAEQSVKSASKSDVAEYARLVAELEK